MKYYLLLILSLFFSCSISTKTLDFGNFTMEVPKNWNAIENKGVDSYIGRIAIDETDTIFFDLGKYSNTLEEADSFFIENGSVYLIGSNNAKPAFYGKADTTDFEKLKKNERIIDTINGRKATIIMPRKTGFGTTGIYVDSLWKKGSGIDKFQLNGVDLRPKNEKLLLKALRTIVFKK